MFRKLGLTSIAFGGLAILFACAVANAQTQSRPASAPASTPTPRPQDQTIVNTTKSNTKDFRVAPTEAGGTTGWNGRVQGRVLITSVVVTFSDPQDYDHIVTGEIRLNFILMNTLSGQTVRLDGRQLREGLRSGSDRSRLTVNVIVDNMSAPLSEAACGVISPSAENTGDDVNITLSYGNCGGAPAQRPGQPIGGIVVHGGRHPHGIMNIVVGDSRLTTLEEATAVSRALSVTPVVASKGNGSPKAQGF